MRPVTGFSAGPEGAGRETGVQGHQIDEEWGVGEG